MSRKLSASFMHISSGYKTKRVETGVKCAKIERKNERQGEKEREREREREGEMERVANRIHELATANLGMVFLSRKRDVQGA